MSKRKRTKSQYYGLLMIGMAFAMFVVTLFSLMQPKTESGLKATTEETNQSVIRSREHFFEVIREKAQESANEHGLFASVIMAQAALESDFGESELAKKYNNLFGIKGTKDNGAALLTKEFQNNQWIEVEEYFRVYKSWDESIVDHGNLIQRGTAWNPMQYIAVLQAKTYQEAAKGLVRGGYATDPKYAEKLMAIIEQYQLYRYDQ